MVLTVLIFLFVVVLWIFNYLFTLRFRDFAKKVGGPRGLPLIGVLLDLIFVKDVLYILPRFTGKTKSAFFWIGSKPTFYTYDPDHIEKILTAPECINKSEIYDIIDHEMGSGIMTSKSPKWNKHRKLLNPCFSHKILLSFFPIFNQKSDIVLAKLDKLVGCGENDLQMLLQKFSLETSYATTVGDDVSRSVAQNETFLSHVERYLNTVFERSIYLWMRFEIFFRFFKLYKPYKESKEIVHSFVENLLAKKLSEVEKTGMKDMNRNQVIQSNSIDIVKPQHIFIDLAIDIHLKNILTWEEVCNEAYVVIAAAFETSATTFNNILMFIAMHPEYQEKLYEEVISVFPQKDFTVTYEHLNDLVYMDMFIDETLRVAPSVPLISRHVDKNAKLEDDLLIPHGCLVIIDIFNLHRSKDIWGSNAHKFDPENCLEKNQRNKHPYAYIPFSKGLRNCIGWRYARMFIKVALSKILRSYRLSTSFRYDDLKFETHLSLRYEVMPKIEIHRR